MDASQEIRLTLEDFRLTVESPLEAPADGHEPAERPGDLPPVLRGLPSIPRGLPAQVPNLFQDSLDPIIGHQTDSTGRLDPNQVLIPRA